MLEISQSAAATAKASSLTPPPPPASDIDAEKLAARLSREVEGEVRFDVGSRALYATDGSNYRQTPIGVVIPRAAADVIAAVEICREFGAPILGRGGGTSLAGQCCNVAVLFDFSKYMNKILELDPQRQIARVEPGVVLDRLRDAANLHDLTFAPDPSTHSHCTLGGMIGNNSCGVHSVMGGKTEENVWELDVLLYDGTRMQVAQSSEEEVERIIGQGGRRGQIYAALRDLRDRNLDALRTGFPHIPRRVSGYSLDQLLPEHRFDVAKSLVGTEGTCVMVLEATLRLLPWPRARSLLVLGYPTVYEAADHVTQVLQGGPIGLEGIDERLVQDMITSHIHPKDVELLPRGQGWLLVEFGGDDKRSADAKAKALMAKLERLSDAPSMHLYDDPEVEKTIWKVREAGLAATAHVPGKRVAWEGWEDAAVPPENLGVYLRKFRDLLKKFQYDGALYGHFGQGCVHTRIDFDLETAEGIHIYRAFVEEAADLVVSLGGSLSGEHGDGQSRGELLPRMYSPQLMRAFEEFKSIWDPLWKMNPGKKVRPYRLDENLRLGNAYAPPVLPTHFKFPEDQGSWEQANLRCVGIGECRKTGTETMCPSYRATMEEKHSTRGRARLLWEMLHNNPLKGFWRNEEVRDALDLCLACKGCKGECPVNVDMATYKAEFLSHHYQGRLRPRHAYAMGLIYWWARLASHIPRLVNFVTHAPVFGPLTKWLGGIAREREMPRFATQTFKAWFRGRKNPPTGGDPVILWADTFNNHFFPDVLKAAVEVLEAGGKKVIVPDVSLCCGRPLYDFGMLNLAKRQLRQILEILRPQIREGIPIVGLEPSCVAVFRDELRGLFPHDEDAKRLKRQVFDLAEFVVEYLPDLQLRSVPGKALVHGHCHHKALWKMKADEEVLKRLALDYELLDSGCCGMAGSFGFERDHYEISQQIGNLALFPRVKQADDATLLIADGFSCREQIVQASGRKPLHLSQVLRGSLQGTRPAVVEETSAQPQHAHALAMWGFLVTALVAAVAFALS